MDIKHSNNRPAPGLEVFNRGKPSGAEDPGNPTPGVGSDGYGPPDRFHPLFFPEGKTADYKYARLTRQQYDDWYKRFYPKQRELMEQSQSGTLLKSQLGRVDDNFDGASEAASRGQDMQMARYGLSSKDDPNRDAKLALSKVSAKNGLRDHERERSMNTLSGGSMGLRTNQQNQMPR